MARVPRRSTGGFKALVFAVAVHLLAVGLLALSVNWTWDVNQQEPGIVDAVVVDDARVKAEVERLRADAQRRNREEDQAQKAVQEAARQRQVEQQQRQIQQQQRAESQRREQEETKRKLVETERKQAAEAAKQRLAAAEQKKEQERIKKQQEHRRQETEAELREQLAAEEQQREATAQQQKVAQQQREEQARGRFLNEEQAKYVALIKQKVNQNWIRPVGIRKAMRCTVEVRLTSGGQVITATVTHSSGNPAFDRSAESAVHKAAPLPVPADKGLFEAEFRKFEFVFNPED